MDKQFMLFSERNALAKEYEEWVNTPLEDGSKIKDCALSVITFMSIKGFCKIPEGGVVLTGTETVEQIEDLLVDFDEMSFYPATLHPNPDEYIREWKSKLIYAIWQLRKETAEKFAERLKEQFIGAREYRHLDTGTAWGEPCIGGLINNKIDEICKEITEGKK